MAGEKVIGIDLGTTNSCVSIMESGEPVVIACRFAACPTSRSPVFVNPTTDGVVRPPSAFAMTTGSPPCMIATHELVVPKSIPITFSAAIVETSYEFKIFYPCFFCVILTRLGLIRRPFKT